jgi:hypothetical protein
MHAPPRRLPPGILPATPDEGCNVAKSARARLD